MKELSIEEKAKRYDEALEAIKSLQEVNPSDEGIQNWVNEDFPELKESEDEKIMKTLYKMAKVPRKEIYEAEGITKEQALAWLEKQSKQKETLCDKCKKTQPSHSCQDITALGRCALEKQGEYKPAFNIDIPFGAKDSELMEASYYIPEGFHAEIEGNNVVIKKGEQKLAWSEEDEKKANNLYVLLDQMISFNMLSDKDATEFKDWLKSLKERYTWKPSDEQMEVLKEVKNIVGRKYKSYLNSLYSDLNKLRKK